MGSGRHTLAVSYTLLAAALAAGVFLIHYQAPILYAQLVAEDYPGEYATSIAFGVAGLWMIAMAFLPGPRTRKLCWLMIGLAAVVVAGEEISWGERFLRSVLGVTTPAAVREANLQNEFNLHNLEVINIHASGYAPAAWALLVWVLVSALVSTLRPQGFERLMDAGVPFVPPRLSGMFVLAPAFILLQPVAWWPEIAELLMGLTALAWTYDRFLHLSPAVGETGRRHAIRTIGVPAGLAVVLPLMAVILASFTPDDTFGIHLNKLASYYVDRGRGHYRQAEAVYQHITANPRYLTPETRLNYATMLKDLGRDAEAAEILAVATRELEDADRLGEADSRRLRLLGAAYRSAGKNQEAQAVFARAIEIDDRQLQAASGPDAKAVVLLSIAKTLATCGDRPAAVAAVQQALSEVRSALFRKQIKRWLEDDEDEGLDAPTAGSPSEPLCGGEGGQAGRGVADPRA